MFVVDPDRKFTRKVAVFTPTENGGHTKGEFKATFKMIADDRIEELRNASDREFLDAVLVGVDGVGDAHGNALESDVAVDLVKSDSCACAAAVAEYIDSTVGKNRRRKN